MDWNAATPASTPPGDFNGFEGDFEGDFNGCCECEDSRFTTFDLAGLTFSFLGDLALGRSGSLSLKTLQIF